MAQELQSKLMGQQLFCFQQLGDCLRICPSMMTAEMASVDMSSWKTASFWDVSSWNDSDKPRTSQVQDGCAGVLMEPFKAATWPLHSAPTECDSDSSSESVSSDDEV